MQKSERVGYCLLLNVLISKCGDFRRVHKIKALIKDKEEKAKKEKEKSELQWLLLFAAIRDTEMVSVTKS